MYDSADSRYHDEYLETRVLTATQTQLHLMVLEAAIRHARLGRQQLILQDLEQTYLQLNKSREFVSELIGGLNPEYAPEMVESLKKLFSFVYRNLALADMERNVTRIDEALHILEMHRETWIELISRLPGTSTVTEHDTLEWQG